MSAAPSGTVRGMRRLRRGELIALAGVVLLVASLFVPSYHSPAGQPRCWDTFGAAVALLLAAVFAGLAMVVSAADRAHRRRCRYPPRCGACRSASRP